MNKNDEINMVENNTLLKINDIFKLPIYYNDQKMRLHKNTISDLELVQTIDPSCNPMYSFFLENNNELSNIVVKQISEYYTTDTIFLKENQTLLKEYKSVEQKYSNIYIYKRTLDIWNELKLETGFKEKYYYVEWPMLEFLNKSEHFLQFMTIFNMASPVISLFVPILILIIPFFIIRLKGLQLNFHEYFIILKHIISHNAIGKLFTDFNNVSLNQKIYMLVSAGFYIFSFYQNIMVCIRYNSNMKKIHNYLKIIEEYLDHTILSMDNYLIYSSQLPSQEKFNETVNHNKIVLSEFRTKLQKITDYKYSLQKVTQIGHVLKYFYELYNNDIYNDAFMYSFGFNGYVDCIEGIVQNIKDKKIHFINFTNSLSKNNFKNNYYAPLKNGNPVKNNIKLNKNLIITGPNASGKTTTIKSILINVIMSQQFGCGFYSSGKLKPYNYIHCYLNIPDTSGRDSLFQSEVRRCKEIMDNIDSNKKETHLCLFDELFSGTNPDDAITTSTSFMKYIIKNKNITCLLTTHFIKVCENLDSIKNIKNLHMYTILNKDKTTINYTYLLKNGISDIKGGINILHDMNYPKEIIDDSIRIKNI